MNIKRLVIFLAMVSAAVALIAGCAQPTPSQPQPAKPSPTTSPAQPSAAPAKVVKLKFAHYQPPTYPSSKMIDQWAQEVNKRSKGSITVDVFPAGQVVAQNDALQAVSEGRTDLTVLHSGAIGKSVPEVQLTSIPFLFGYDMEKKAMFNKEMVGYFNQAYEKWNVLLMGVFSYGDQHMFAVSKFLKTPADMKGMKMRTPTPFDGEFLKSVGSAPVSMPSGDVYMALQTKTIEGCLTALSSYATNKQYEVAPYVTISYENATISHIGMNKKTFESLTAEQKQIITDVNRDIIEGSFMDISKGEEEKLLADADKIGFKVYRLTAAERQAFADASKDVENMYLSSVSDLGRKILALAKSLK